MTPDDPAPTPGIQVVEPLDPDSPKGREVAERLSEVLADVRLGIAEREAAEAAKEKRCRARDV